MVSGNLRVIGDEGEQLDLGSSGMAAAQQEARAGEEEEARRLFYVAATRPRDLLVLSGENAGRAGAWREWINRYLLSADRPTNLVRIIPYQALREAAGPLERGGEAVDIPSAGLLASDFDREESSAPPESYRMAATVLSGIPELRGGETEDEFQKARREYVRTGLVNLPPAYFMNKGSGADDSGEDLSEKASSLSRQIDAGLFGHAVLESIDFNKPTGQQIRESAAGYGGDEAGAASLERQLAAAVAEVRGVLEGAEPDKVIRELPFTARFTHDGATVLVDGAIDLIYFKNGVWQIVDYKFSGRGPAELKKKYGLQLAIYREAVSSLIPGKTERKPLFREGEAPAPFTMTIIGIGPDGTIRKVPITDRDAGDLPARVVAAARLIREETSPRPAI